MGRETTALVSWQGQSGESKVLLESTELILRGGVNAKFPRGAIAAASAGSSGLTLTINGAPLHAEMSEIEAARWVKAIATPPPSLATKLGVKPGLRVYVLGQADDPTLTEALRGAIAPAPGQAGVLLTVIEDGIGLNQALELAQAHPTLPLWCVFPKGKSANPDDTAIRTAFRAAGWIDNKTSAVSERLTATRYALKR
jgi:hypothetical protein